MKILVTFHLSRRFYGPGTIEDLYGNSGVLIYPYSAIFTLKASDIIVFPYKNIKKLLKISVGTGAVKRKYWKTKLRGNL